jgi:ADP-heptose:LPS heptosyltransferase
MQEVQFLWFSDNELHMTASSPSNVFNTANQLFFEEYIALLDACDLIVCPDTSAYHLGEMLGVPSLVLEGSVDLKTRTKYYKHAHSVGLRKKLPCQPCHDFQARRDCYRQEDSPWCLSQITAQRVVRAIKKLLSTTSS